MERTTILPPGIAPPLTENSSHSHNALIVITSSISLFLALASLAIRIYATRRRGVILKDDYVLALVVIFACAQISVTLQQVHYGWGKSEDLISSTDYDQMAKIGLVVDILYILVIGLSKICTVMFYRNLSLQTNTLLSNMILGSCGVWIVLGMTLLGVRCSGGSSQDINDRCPGLYPRWQAISAIDIVLETVILAYPVKIIYNVQIPVLKKLKVMCILSCRAVFVSPIQLLQQECPIDKSNISDISNSLIPLCAIHLAYINTQLTSPDPPLDGAYGPPSPSYTSASA